MGEVFFVSSNGMRGGAGVGSLKSSGLDVVIDARRSRSGGFVRRDHQLSGRDRECECDKVELEIIEYRGTDAMGCESEEREAVGLWGVE